MAQRTLKEQLEEAEQHSKEVLDQLLDENTTRDEFRTLMKSYVGYRFFSRAGGNEDGRHFGSCRRQR